jgi:hypothetical protein
VYTRVVCSSNLQQQILQLLLWLLLLTGVNANRVLRLVMMPLHDACHSVWGAD